MHTPSLFRCEDPALTLDVAARHPFATWITTDDGGGLEVNHLPSVVVARGESWRVLTHVARSNALAGLATNGRDATVVFHGPHAYVSPTWYEHPNEEVPTWNYVAIHFSGSVRAQDEDETRNTLRSLTATFEGDKGWNPDVLGRIQFEEIARGVIGLELTVSGYEHKRKLSQNRSEEDQKRVFVRLRTSTDAANRAVADAMGRSILAARSRRPENDA